MHERYLKAFYNSVKPDTKSKCWMWVGETTKDGTGTFSFFSDPIWYGMPPHKVMYMLHFHMTPKTLRKIIVIQACGNLNCVNPDHLRAEENE